MAYGRRENLPTLRLNARFAPFNPAKGPRCFGHIALFRLGDFKARISIAARNWAREVAIAANPLPQGLNSTLPCLHISIWRAAMLKEKHLSARF